jgi:hypothetical protein
MNNFTAMLCLAIIALVSGCSSETAKRTAYETIQNIHQQDCLKNPQTECEKRDEKRDSYEDYERKRKELEPAN